MKKLTLENVCFSYTEYPFLQNINFEISEVDGCIILAGKNGVGKSTLLNVMNELFPYQGSIYKNLKVNYLPYDNPLLESLSVEDNLKFFYRCFQKKNFSFEDETVKRVLQALNIDYFKQKVSNCSSGEQKKAALACLLLSDADLLILDEPFVAMDYQSVDEFIKLINEWKANKIFLITTHSFPLAKKFVDRLLVIEDGHLSKDTIDKSEINMYFEGSE